MRAFVSSQRARTLAQKLGAHEVQTERRVALIEPDRATVHVLPVRTKGVSALAGINALVPATCLAGAIRGLWATADIGVVRQEKAPAWKLADLNMLPWPAIFIAAYAV